MIKEIKKWYPIFESAYPVPDFHFIIILYFIMSHWLSNIYLNAIFKIKFINIWTNMEVTY